MKSLPSQKFLAALAIGLLTTSIASAQTTTGSIAVSATVLSTCAVGSGTLAFGNYAGTEISASANISVTCTSGTNYTVLINGGSSGGDTTTRKMAGAGADKLNYKVWQESGHTTNWNDTDSVVAGTGTGLAQTVTVYATVPSSQSVAAGAYSDTLTITVSY